MRCTLPLPLDAITVAGMAGNDSLQLEGFPETTTPVVLGGEGSDELSTGNGTEDMLVDGNGSGNDTLRAGSYDDALIANEGADVLQGGNGNDLLLSASLCDGDTLQGAAPGEGDGSSVNSASWAKLPVGQPGVIADLAAGKAGDSWSGGIPACSSGTPATLANIDDLEGSSGPDHSTATKTTTTSSGASAKTKSGAAAAPTTSKPKTKSPRSAAAAREPTPASWTRSTTSTAAHRAAHTSTGHVREAGIVRGSGRAAGAESGRGHRLAVAITVLMLVIGAGVGLGARSAAGDEPTPPATARTTPGPTARQTAEALGDASVEGFEDVPATDPQVAEELPHRDLERQEALELTEGVFGAQLEEPAGIFDELEPERFLSDNVAVASSSTLPEAEASGPLAPEQPVLIESTMPLRTENAEGEEEVVDLTLASPEGSGGELKPENPLTEVSIPAHLGEGISVGGVGVSVAGAPQEAAPTNVEGQYAFYPNVAENTDLAVAPTPTGIETMTTIRSADAPLVTTYELSLPEGTALESGPGGTAEVANGGKTDLLIPPPTATDASGVPVPATQRIDGDSVVVEISPEPSTQFPVLVDPNFIVEGWNWTYEHQSQSAWTPSNTAPGLAPFPYAFWETQSNPPNPNPAPGLDLTSAGWGNGTVGGMAQWLYTVPRYNQDVARYGSPPTTWISYLVTENVWFLTHGNSGNYPAMVVGLAAPGSAGW